MAPFALVPIFPPHGACCISHKFGHQIAQLAFLHCLGLPYWHYQLVLSWELHQLESHKLSFNKVWWQTLGPIDRTPGIPGSARNTCKIYPQDILKISHRYLTDIPKIHQRYAHWPKFKLSPRYIPKISNRYPPDIHKQNKPKTNKPKHEQSKRRTNKHTTHTHTQ